jgi:hypothetical protein
VAVSGDVAVIGASADDDNGSRSGSAYVFGVGSAVEIDIKPRSDPNAINPVSPGMIPVAILGSVGFDVDDLEPDTLAFGPSGAALAHPDPTAPHYADVNDDGFTDLLGHFRTPETGIAFGETEACLTGELFGATPFEACDDIVTVPMSCGIGFELAFLLPPLMWLYRRRRLASA